MPKFFKQLGRSKFFRPVTRIMIKLPNDGEFVTVIGHPFTLKEIFEAVVKKYPHHIEFILAWMNEILNHNMEFNKLSLTYLRDITRFKNLIEKRIFVEIDSVKLQLTRSELWLFSSSSSSSPSSQYNLSLSAHMPSFEEHLIGSLTSDEGKEEIEVSAKAEAKRVTLTEPPNPDALVKQLSKLTVEYDALLDMISKGSGSHHSALDKRLASLDEEIAKLEQGIEKLKDKNGFSEQKGIALESEQFKAKIHAALNKNDFSTFLKLNKALRYAIIRVNLDHSFYGGLIPLVKLIQDYEFSEIYMTSHETVKTMIGTEFKDPWGATVLEALTRGTLGARAAIGSGVGAQLLNTLPGPMSTFRV